MTQNLEIVNCGLCPAYLSLGVMLSLFLEGHLLMMYVAMFIAFDQRYVGASQVKLMFFAHSKSVRFFRFATPF